MYTLTKIIAIWSVDFSSKFGFFLKDIVTAKKLLEAELNPCIQ